MKINKNRVAREEGQSIVILAMAMVGLLAFAGLAVDAGVIYAGSVRLARGVDAAALAGVVELPYETGTANADGRARQFLAANEIWPSAEITGTTFFQSARQGSTFGSVRYLVTATHQVDLYFLPLVNFRYVRLRDSAVAEYNALVNMSASQTGIYGLEQTANLSIFGPNICTSYGDPYTPLTTDNSGTPNPWYDELDGVYHFQIDIPADYEGRAQDLTRRWNKDADTNDVVRVEIWDPDSYNTPLVAPPNPNQIVFTNTVTGLPQTLSPACLTSPTNDYNRKQPCTPKIRNYDPQNPFWFVRIDENRGGGSPPGNGTCAEPSSYNPGYNTETRYTLYYYYKRGDGSLERRNLARYTKGGAESDSDTDLRWVSPGGSLPGDPVPDGWVGSPYGFAWDAGNGNFEIVDLDPESPTSETPGIYVSPVDGRRTLFLDVRGVEGEGASENGFDLWVGPRYQTVPGEVNARNVDIVLKAGDYHSSAGAIISGIGHLPMNSNATEVVTLTLAYVPEEWGGRTIRVSNFDNDSGAQPPVTFIFNTMPYDDWHSDGALGPNNLWVSNAFTVPSAPDYTFYGGFLQVVYKAGAHDTFGWAMTTDATPWLVE